MCAYDVQNVPPPLNFAVQIYTQITGEMVDFGKSDQMIK